MSINLNLGDCLEAMKAMPDNAYDLAIVDPPYGININHNMGRRKGQKHSGHKKVNWDNETPTQEYFNEIKRVSANQIIWGANYMIDKILTPSACWLMWDKGFSEDVSFAQYELAWTSFSSSAKKFNKHPNQTNKIHPTQKPVKLYEWLLDNYAKEGDSILDTHLGSGSIAIACHNRGFSLDAWEIDAEYHAAAVKRYEQHIAQLTLF
jgi:site-specific DNA-methyltransferase (adenine-specific)